MLKFFKTWTLPISMLAGAIGYFVFANVTFLEPTKPFMYTLIAYLTPFLIFAQLLLTFCKISVRELMPSPWHGWLLLIQAVSSLVLAALLLWLPMREEYRDVFEGAMVCLICPTATAAAVITGKLGGSASSLTTYTLLSNLLAAIVVPLVFPALFLRRFIPPIHRFLAGLRDMAFYLWAVALAIVTGQTVKSLVNSEAEIYVEILIALGGLITCIAQFYWGKRIGKKYNDRISAGQALGQKNTVLAIWMSYTYLNPLSSVGPGSYVLWQNIINSWQLWKKRRNEMKY